MEVGVELVTRDERGKVLLTMNQTIYRISRVNPMGGAEAVDRLHRELLQVAKSNDSYGVGAAWLSSKECENLVADLKGRMAGLTGRERSIAQEMVANSQRQLGMIVSRGDRDNILLEIISSLSLLRDMFHLAGFETERLPEQDGSLRHNEVVGAYGEYRRSSVGLQASPWRVSSAAVKSSFSCLRRAG